MIALEKLREYMNINGIDIYIHKNTDPHQSEYLSKHYKFIEYLSHFSGSNATIVVTKDKAGLWTDGRYFIQAENEISGSGFQLYRLQVPGECTVSEFIKNNISKATLGLDGRLFSCEEYEKYEKIAKKNDSKIKSDFYPMDNIWDEREELEHTKVWEIDTKYTGQSAKEKVDRLREYLNEHESDAIVLNDLCEIAWLLNLRAGDIPFVPVFFSNIYVSKKEVVLFTDSDIDIDIKNNLPIDRILPISSMYDFLGSLKKKKVIIDPKVCNYSILRALCESKVKQKKSPIIRFKAIKNDIEIKNTFVSHVNDGAVLTKTIYYLKQWSKNKKREIVSEYDISKKLIHLRKEIDDYIEDSFETIAAYGPNAAMMHYGPKKENCAALEPKGFVLIDTGGHYLTGTTDVTRTISLGELSDKQKEGYTRVLKAHLRLMDAKFHKGVTGENLDILARSVFWEDGIDYLSGTGHGVGYLLSVHEAPNSIRWRYTTKPEPIVPGMITTDEPGLYIQNEFGIRIENELLCVPHLETEYGEFYKFTPITFAPYDTEAIVIEMLDDNEKRILNDYNRIVFEKISPLLNEDEKDWLKQVTKEV